jgi:lipoprotein NlpI
MNKPNLAVADFTQSIKINPTYPISWNSRGLSYYNQELYTEAIHDYCKAIELDNQDNVFFYNRALCYYKIDLI